MTFVTSSIGLDTFVNNTSVPLILQSQLQDHPHIITLFERLIPKINFSSSVDLIHSLWNFSQDSFYRLMRRCVLIQTTLSECHVDLLSDNSHRTWMGLTGRLFELSQMQRERVWEFASQLSVLMNWMSMLVLPSISIRASSFEAFISALELFSAALPQFLSFLGTPYEESFLNLDDATSNYIPTAHEHILSESLLASVLNQFAIQVRSLQRLLANSPEVYLLSQTNFFCSPTVRITTTLLNAVSTTLSSMQDQIRCLKSSLINWEKFIFHISTTQCGVPFSVRHYFCESLSRFISVSMELMNLNDGREVFFIDGESLLSDCILNAESTIKASSDYVSQ